MPNKTCNKCLQELSYADFNIAHGSCLASSCRECRKRIERERYKNNKERYLEVRQRYKKKHPEHRGWTARWAKDHPERRKETRQKYEQRHPETTRIRNSRRRARLAGCLINDFTVEQWRSLLKIYSYRCAYCFTNNKKLEQDHIVPLSRGGNHTMSNIVPACKSCNTSKHNKNLVEWLDLGGVLSLSL